MTGVSFSCRSLRSTSMPFNPGSITSSKIKSNEPERALSKPSLPSAAFSTSFPSCFNSSSTKRAMPASSSMIKILLISSPTTAKKRQIVYIPRDRQSTQLHADALSLTSTCSGTKLIAPVNRHNSLSTDMFQWSALKLVLCPSLYITTCCRFFATTWFSYLYVSDFYFLMSSFTPAQASDALSQALLMS